MSEDAIKRAKSVAEKHLGKGVVFNKADGIIPSQIEIIPTGSMALDLAIGNNAERKGIPRGRMTEIYGNFGSAKSTLALHIIANAQKLGLSCLYIDAEQTLDLQYAEALGVDTDKLEICQLEITEHVLFIIDTFIGITDVIVVDSVAALVPKSEIEGNYGDSHMGLQARLMNQAMRKLTKRVNDEKTALIWLNQTRANLGMSFGAAKTTTGGKGLSYFCSLRMDTARIAYVKAGEIATGDRIRAKITKNKVFGGVRHCEFEVVFGKGIDHMKEVIDAAIEKKIIVKSGAWFAWEDKELKAQGMEKAKSIFEDYREELMGLIDGAKNI